MLTDEHVYPPRSCQLTGEYIPNVHKPFFLKLSDHKLVCDRSGYFH